MGDSERIRALEAKRERVLGDLERELIDEWDLVSEVHAPQVPLPPPPMRAQTITLPEEPKPHISNETKRVIALVSLFLGTAIAAALKGLQ